MVLKEVEGFRTCPRWWVLAFFAVDQIQAIAFGFQKALSVTAGRAFILRNKFLEISAPPHAYSPVT
jgi:hypothetical protein